MGAMPGWEQILQAATGVMDVEMSVKPHDPDPRGIESCGVLYYSFHKPEGFPRIPVPIEKKLRQGIPLNYTSSEITSIP